MIHMNRNEITYLVGDERLEPAPFLVYSEEICNFLDDLSQELRKDASAKRFPDIMTFAFWCRRGNITKLKQEYPFLYNRVGRGMVFHIAPSNVPINFAYTLAFGLLAGNANVVRVSQKGFEQVDIVCRVLERVLQRQEYEFLRNQIQVVSYGHDAKINDYYSEKCDVRVIWGGDSTIKTVRQSQLRPKATEITFADRYSFAVFDEGAVEALSVEQCQRLAEKFYNDTYLMDQNACSSPHLVLWLNDVGGDKIGRRRFWQALYQTAVKYDMPEKKVMDKYTLLCENAIDFCEEAALERYDNLLYVVSLKKLPRSLDILRGKCGLFYQGEIASLQEIGGGLSDKVQTCVVFGVDTGEMAKCFIENHVRGVDRIVQVGEAMDIGIYWDGYDVIGSLSRGIVF